MFGGNTLRPNMTKYKDIIPLNPLYFNRNPYILFYRLFTKTALKNVKTAQNGKAKWAAAYAAAHFVVGKKILSLQFSNFVTAPVTHDVIIECLILMSEYIITQ